ncbi:MAG: hypothetical protein INR65_16205, partial [Gluconacetobacter diazotrophicus]|nr:hypothetical protein [Gluconacetobacter diazotrophicus]
VGDWSAPVALPSGTRFGLVFDGRIRLQLGTAVLLLDASRGADLGAVDAGPLRVKAVGNAPVTVTVVSEDGEHSFPGSGSPD